MNIESFHFLKTSKSYLFVLFIVSFFVFPVGGAFAFDRKEIVQSQDISYTGRGSTCLGAPGGDFSGSTGNCPYPIPGGTDLKWLKGMVSVKHVLEQVSSAGVLNKDDIVKYSYDPELPVYIIKGSVIPPGTGTGTGNWETGVDIKSFNILNDGLHSLVSEAYGANDPFGNLRNIWVYNHWTGVKPLVYMVSSDPAVLSCGTGSLSPLECVAVAAGTAEVRAEIGPTPLRIWLYGLQSESNNTTFPNLIRFDGWVSEVDENLFGIDGYTLYGREANETGWSRTVDTDTNAYLSSHATAISYWDSPQNSPRFLVFGYPRAVTMGAANAYFFNWTNQYMFALDLRISDIEAISADAVASGTSFKDALIKKYPSTVPMVTEFSPKNQSNTLYLPPTTPNPPDDPWIVVVEEVKPNTTNPPTVNATNPLDVNLNSTVTIMATDNELDDVKYCIDWNMDGDTIDLAVPSSDFNQDEGCLPSVVGVFSPSGTTHTTWQSWKTVGPKTFQVRTLDRRNGVSTWTSGMVTVPLPPLVCTENQSEDCTNTSLLGVCKAGTRTRTCSNNAWGSWGSCTALTQKGKEVCNGLDDDCDGPVDEGGVCTNSKTCVLNKRCERSRGENFLNCEDCRIEVKEVKAPFPNLWASLLGVFGKR